MILKTVHKSVLGVSKMEILDNIGFFLSGVGAIFFFFIYAFIVKSTIMGDLASRYHGHMVAIDSYWLKNIKDKEEDLIVKTLPNSDLL